MSSSNSRDRTSLAQISAIRAAQARSVQSSGAVVALFFIVTITTGCGADRAGLFGGDGQTKAPFDRTDHDGGNGGGPVAPFSSTGGASASSGGAPSHENPDARAAITEDDATVDGAPSSSDAGQLGSSDAASSVDSGWPNEAGHSAPDVDANGSGGACAGSWWYPDDDGDHYGRSTAAVEGCAPPTNGTWATVGGDCDDDDALVNPGQTAYFGVPFIAANGDPSYDYDCSGDETGNPAQATAPLCEALTLDCTGSGYTTTATRAGPGQNPLCGSTTMSTCSSGLFCVSVSTTADTPYGCR